MEKININLLPVEDALRQKELQRLNLIQNLSIGAMLVLIFLASATVALRVLQAQKIRAISTQAQTFEVQVEGQKVKESLIHVLKDRLNLLGQLGQLPQKQVKNYSILGGALPAQVLVSSTSIDRSGNILLSLQAPDATSLDLLLSNLTSPEVLQSFSRVEIESLSRGRDGVFRANLKIIAQ